jgi:hypothetical protein
MNSSAQIPPGGNQSRPESLDGKQPGSRIGIGVGALLKNQRCASNYKHKREDMQQFSHVLDAQLPERDRGFT